VKIRGFRIELGEIESMLSSHPAVRQCVVVPHETRAGTKRLVAYVVASTDTDRSVLRDYLEHRLPDYMIPSGFLTLDSLPMTPSGKVDWKALPPPGEEARERGDYVAPRGPDEEVLAGVWADVLGLQRVGVRDRFIEIGGDSLQAIEVISRLRELLGVSPSVRHVLEKATVEALATALADSVGREELVRRCQLVLELAAMSDDEAAMLASGTSWGASS
jgi:acyl carrier protein